MSRRQQLVRLWLTLVALLCVGCRCGKPPLATLFEAGGDVQRDFAAAVDVWLAASIGAAFEFGDAVRTGETSTAVVVFDDEARLKLEPATTVRFVRELTHGASATLQVESGSVVVEATKFPINLQTDFGPAVIQPGAVVRAARKGGGLRLLVEVGVAQLDPGGSNDRTLPLGQSVEIAIGAAVVDAIVPPPIAATAPSTDPAPSVVAMDELRVVATVKKGNVLITYEGKSSTLTVGPHPVQPGATLRLKGAAEVTLSQGGREATLVGPGVYTVGEGGELVKADEGVITLRGTEVVVALPGGWIKAVGAEPTLVEITRHGQTTDVFVRAGSVTVKQGDEMTTLSAGQGAHVDGRNVQLLGHGVGYRDLSASAGSSVVLHNAAPPTAVGFDFAGKCEHVGVLEIIVGQKVTTWASGRGSVNLELPTGVHSYRLRCLSKAGAWSEPVAVGRITGYADSGATQLPSYTPSNVVNADGRKYTLLYQNRLPSVTVQWPNAPPADSYTLTHTGEGGTRTVTTKAPRHSYASGALGEGQHGFQFQSASGRSSRQAAATIQFDNAAPKASISSPANGGFAPNSEVEVRGIALPGWEVLAQGQPLTTDAHGRFSGRVTASERGVLLTFSHAKRGAHFYLRRAK
jgi:hypothetical protein